MTTQVRLTPVDGPGAGAPLAGRIERSCPLGECRTQRVRLSLSTGKVLEGELRLLSAGSAGGSPHASGAAVPVPARRPAVLGLADPDGTRISCEVLLSPDTREGSGLCTTGSGVGYEIRIGPDRAQPVM
jgi:hypothetical protein